MGILLKVIISRNLDGVHVNQTRFKGKWKNIFIRSFNSPSTSNKLGSVINYAVEPFHLPSSMNRSLFSKVSTFMENPNDRSFLGVKESGSSLNIQTSQLMGMNTNTVDFLSVFCKILMTAPTRPPLAPISIK